MRILFFVASCNILPVILAHFQLINENLGDLHLHAKAGTLPERYYPLSQQEQHASEKIVDIIELIQLVPNIDPFKIAWLDPLGIDVPYLWLSGKIYMKNLVVVGIKNFVVNAVEMRLRNIRTDLNMSWPFTYIEGDFNLQASVTFLPIVFSCHVSVSLTDMNVVVSSGSKPVHAPPTGEVLQVDSAEVQVDIRNVQLNLTSVNLGGSEEHVGLAVAQLFTEIAEKDNVYDGLLKTVLNMVNKELLKVPFGMFSNYLLSN